MALSESNLIAYIEDTLGVDTSDINSDSLLFSDGIIDSFSMVDLITFIESEAGIKVGPGDVTLDNLDSISRILKFAESQ